MSNIEKIHRTCPGFIQPRWEIRVQEAIAVQELASSIRSLSMEKKKTSDNPRELLFFKKLTDMNLKILACLMLNRGLNSAESALRFLRPDFSGLRDQQLPGMDAAVDRLNLARQRRERVFVHGDYDADGITATALLVNVLQRWGVDTCWYLPHRIEDGYGLSRNGIERAKAEGCSLLVTVDCGISNGEEVGYAKDLGLDVIITDHHLPPEELPAALAVVNPKRADSTYPFSDLAGVGVAWKLAAALNPENVRDSACLQLAALGTVADMVPLVDENRIIAWAGLEEMKLNPLPGIAALAAVAGYDLGTMDASGIAFGLAPRLNAAGRMDSADNALALLLESDPDLAAGYAGILDEVNQRRRRVEEEIFLEAFSQAGEQFRLNRRILVLHGINWHPGVVGIVAAKILEEFYRPAIILSGQGKLTGSARSVPGFDIHAGLAAVSQHLESFGGHLAAAGLSLREDQLVPFRDALNRYALEAEIDPLLQPTIPVDAQLAPEDIDLNLVDEISLLQPFGFGNPEPCFALEGYRAGTLELAGKDKKHLRLRLESKKIGNMWAIGFGKSSLVHNIDKGAQVRVAGSLHLNRWNGRTSVQMRVTHVQGPDRLSLEGRQIIDRRRSSEPWLTDLASASGAVFFATTHWSVRRRLGSRGDSCRVILLPPDNYRQKVYNLKADHFCFLDPAWNSGQLREIIALLPPHCSLHFFDGEVPEDIIRPNLNLMRSFYRSWKDKGCAKRTELIKLLPDDLAEQLLLERILAIFSEAGLAREGQGKWTLAPVRGNLDLTETGSWTAFSSQLEEYRKWVQGFSAQALNHVLTNI